MAKKLQSRTTRHRSRTLPALGQGSALSLGFAAVVETSFNASASVEHEAVADTEGMEFTRAIATEAAAPASFITDERLTANDIAVVEPEQTEPRVQRVIEGLVEKRSETELEGWAWDPQAPDKRLQLELMEGDKQLSTIVAEIYRPELVQLGCRDGRHGFRVELEEELLSEGSHVLTLRCADTRVTIPGSPIIAERRKPERTSHAVTANGKTMPTIRGQIDKVTDAGIFGWVMMSDRPSQKCMVLLKEREHTVAEAIASEFRMDLLSAGIGDGRYSFKFEPPRGLADGQEHMLDIIEKNTGTKLNKEPVRWFAEPDLDRKEKARPFGASDNELWSTYRELDAVGRSRHTISRGDYARYRQMRCFGTQGATASVLSIADALRESGTLPSRFLTDSMIAAWMSREDLRQRFQRLDEETCQYAILAWFLCVRPIEEGFVLSCEPVAPILTEMANTMVAEEPGSGAGCSALMLAVYCYVASYRGSGLLAPLQCQASDIVPWFFCQGAYHLRVSHAISQSVRMKLAAPRSNGGSATLEWAAHQIRFYKPAEAMVTSAKEALSRLDDADDEPSVACWRDLLRESMILGDQARFDSPTNPILPAACGRLRDAVTDLAELLLIDGQAEYMCIGGNGERLLLKNEWYPVEPTFVWSHAPISTILFCVAGGAVEWLRIGLIFDQAPVPDRGMRVILNHNTLWSGTIGEASSNEMILACTGQCVAQDAPNLLQIEVDRAFVPADHMLSTDHRRLGVGLKRLWVQRAEGLP